MNIIYEYMLMYNIYLKWKLENLYKKHTYTYEANFLAVGLVVRSTIKEKEYLFTIYTYKTNKIH